MNNPRKEKKGKFVEKERVGVKIKPIHIVGLTVILAGIAVAATLLGGSSGDSEAAGDIEFTFETPVANNPAPDIIENNEESYNSGIVEANATQSALPELSIASFDIKGMTCGGCAAGIKRGLGDAEGVTQCEISYRDKGGVVQYDPSITTPQSIADFISGMGFATTVAN